MNHFPAINGSFSRINDSFPDVIDSFPGYKWIICGNKCIIPRSFIPDECRETNQLCYDVIDSRLPRAAARRQESATFNEQNATSVVAFNLIDSGSITVSGR